MQHNPILVIGATGKTGARVVARLEAMALPVRHGTRNAPMSQHLVAILSLMSSRPSPAKPWTDAMPLFAMGSTRPGTPAA